MQKILVTGGGGYIGSHAVKKLLKEGHSVVVFDNFFRGYKKPLEILKKYGELVVFNGDLKNKEDVQKVFEENKIDAVMHFGALCLVNESMEKPEMYFENNVFGTLNLLNAMKDNNVRKIVFSSTCAVYGDAQYLPVDEKHPTNPTNPYGESKLMCEKIIKWYGELYNFNYAILRYFNVCGADMEGEIGDSKKPSELLVQNAVRGALGLQDFKLTCPKVESKDGTPVRDYIDVEDLVEAHLKALQYIDADKSLVCNIGNGDGLSVKEVIQKVKDELGVDFPLDTGEARKGEYTVIYADNSLAKDALRFNSKKDLKDSINSLARWYKNNPNGFDY
ncbi:MAG: UDP-glucose 4-epimerase GalE [Candidatus Pacebacteria bacterium]|nr:UDP-glucose 4-epimerase GalE [Candidatus Paceibacterota bacterium]MCF7862620.1 UDP-glucose 4-epimerase GalE [Candidatus Paceibacterota bacterium]